MPLIDRIKFDSPSDDLLIWKYPSEEIKLGSQLIVNQSQEAIFVKGGKALDLFGPGTHTLTASNIPFVNILVDLPLGGQTPFTAEIWFVNKTVKRNLKWGTKAPIPLMDPLYNYPISLRACGIWGMRITDTRNFITQIIGTLKTIDSRQVEDYFIGEINQRAVDILAKLLVQEKISIFQANSKINDLSKAMEHDLGQEFGRFGIEIVNFNIESISIPEEEKQMFQDVFGRKMEIDQVSQSNVGPAYTTMRTFDTLEKAAENESGVAGGLLAGGIGLGAGLGAGTQLGHNLGDAISMQLNQKQQAGTQDPLELLQTLKQMLDRGLITAAEYEEKKTEILKRM